MLDMPLAGSHSDVRESTLDSGSHDGARPRRRKLKIFLGYASERLEDALEVLKHLESSGRDVIWFDKDALIGGDEWDAERQAAQNDADLVIHLCSNAILERKGVVNRELRQTLRNVDDQPFGALYAVFIRLEPMRLPSEFLRFQYVDYFASGWQEKLSRTIEKRRGQLPAETAKPDPTPVQPMRESVVENQKSSVGPEKIEFSDVTERYECRGEYLRYNEEGLYWTLVNAASAALPIRSYFNAKNDFTIVDDDGLGLTDPASVSSEFTVTCEEFYRRDDFVSLRFYTYFYFSGSAHPNHHIQTLNFFGDKYGEVSVNTLLANSVESGRRVIEFCEKIIAASYSEEELADESFFRHYKEDEEAVWSLISQFNFDRRGMTVNFSPYDILPYSMGSHEVHVPWSFLKPMISELYQALIVDLER